MELRTSLSVRAVAVSLCCVVLAMSAAAAGLKPLKGSFEGSGFTFSGHQTHLGRFTGEITSVTGGNTTATWTAANGDEVYVSTVFTVTGINPSTGLFTFLQEITIEGGTGRFEFATGSATAEGETAGDFSTYFGDIDGLIEY